MHLIIRYFAGWLILATLNCSTKTSVVAPVKDTTFSNPLLSSGPDPWVIQKDTNYYYTHTFGNRIGLYVTGKMSALSNAPLTSIWSPPATSPYSRNLWAPEIHYLQGKWYVYFAADDGNNASHRMYVIENSSSNPLKGSWEFKGKIADPADKWAIDGSVLELNGKMYFIWSGWEGDLNGRQDIYIAKMSNPWTIEGNRVMISSPSYDWEKIGSPSVNEGPEAIKNSKGKLFLTYSASGCWTDDYSLGLLTLKDGGDPMNAADWSKLPAPLFTKAPGNGAFGPGHNSFFKSRDGKEDWILYHANSSAGQGCSGARNPRMQRFTWNADGTPNFGQPVPINIRMRKPGGE